MSRWDLLHLLYSSENWAVSERDRRELAGVQRRCMTALEELPRARVTEVSE